MNRETLFWTALKLAEPDRSRFIDEACGDETEREWIMGMLRVYHEGDKFLEVPAADLAIAETLVTPVDPDAMPRPRPPAPPIEFLRQANAIPDDAPPPTISGCEISGELGRGGLGVVFKGRQPGLDREVAVKFLQARVVGSPELAERFRREAKAMAKLAHPHIVSVYDSGQTAEGFPYFVMEYVEGEDLHGRIRRGRIPEAEALRLAVGICEALAFAHGRGFVHRDIKPQNILLGSDGSVKVADFGLVKLIENPGLTREGAVMGTPLYWAPEQSDPALVMGVDHRADIYAFGGTLYHMLCGLVPDRQYVPPSAVCGCDQRLDAVVARCLEADPALRYDSAAAVLADLNEIRRTRPLRFRLLANAAAVALAGLVAAFVAPTPVAHRLDTMIQDLWMTARPAPAVSDDLVIVAITDDCLRAENLGAWPWDRSLHAQLVDTLAEKRAAAIAFDVFLPEDGDNARTAEGDAALAAAAGRHGRVIFPDFLDSVGWTVAMFARSADASVLTADTVEYASSVIRAQARTSAQCQVERDDADGKLRWVNLFLVDPADKGRPRPNLGLALAMDLKGADGTFSLLSGGVEVGPADGSQTFIPTGTFKRVLVNYPAALDSFPVVAYSDLLAGKSDFDFTGKGVLVGLTATGTTHVTADKHVTVLDPLTPGLFVNAAIANSVLTGEFLREGPRWLSLAAGLLLASVLAFVLLRPRILVALVLAVAFCGAIYAAGLALVAAKGLVLPALPAILVVIFATAALVLAVRFGQRPAASPR